MVIGVGLISPPIGLSVFIMHGMAKEIPRQLIFVGIFPFFRADVARLALLVIFPALILWLPRALGVTG